MTSLMTIIPGTSQSWVMMTLLVVGYPSVSTIFVKAFELSSALLSSRSNLMLNVMMFKYFFR